MNMQPWQRSIANVVAGAPFIVDSFGRRIPAMKTPLEHALKYVMAFVVLDETNRTYSSHMGLTRAVNLARSVGATEDQLDKVFVEGRSAAFADTDTKQERAGNLGGSMDSPPEIPQ